MKFTINIDDKSVEDYVGRTNCKVVYLKNLIQNSIAATMMIPVYSIITEEENGKKERKGRKSR